MTIIKYRQGADLPDVTITWTDDSDQVLDLSTGWTFTVEAGFPGRGAVLTKTTGITGAATAPNVRISWAADELDQLAPGAWPCELTARNTDSGKDRSDAFMLLISAATT